MKIAILSRDGTLYSCKRLREAAIQRGHLVEILDPLSCYMNINPAASSIHYKGRKLPHFDAVIPRIGTAITFYGTAALRQFEMLGSYPLNESVAIARARDKLRSMQLLARQGIDLPVTGIAHSPDDTSDLIDMVGGAPLVVKLVEGTQGIGVVLAETRQAAESVIDAFRGLNAHILVQEYIKEAQGCDIRCLVVGDEVVAAIERRAKEGDFRSNLHRGGAASVASITPQEREIAIKAARTMALDVAGVDILRANRGPLVMEVNASPGLEGIEKTTGLECKIKWPNDIVVHGKKVCGILTEMSTQMDYINYIVIGIGINVQNEAFPEEIGEVATSLRIESGKKQNRAAIIEAVWEEFETYYDIYLKTEDMQGLVGEYNRKLANMNQQVRVLDPKDPYEGTARGITPKGELIVDTWEARKLVSSGEVSVRGLYGYV